VLVAGVDSSTQSCKVQIHDAETGRLVREGKAPHPDDTEVDPTAWWTALQDALARAGGLQDVAALSVGGQQHGMVCLDGRGDVVRPALLWNDTRSDQAARQLTEELGGAATWAAELGLVPVPSFTVTKLRWMRDHEPDLADATEAVCLPHDWLTWRLRGDRGLPELTTDRSDASGTGYWSAVTGSYRPDVLATAFGREVVVPRVAGANEQVGTTTDGAVVLGPGCGDNAGAALGLGAVPGDVVISIGTSGVVSAVSEVAATDPSGTVAGFADATGRFLPLIATINAGQVLAAACRLLRVDFDELSRLALEAPAGAAGLVLVPYLQGERTPDHPDATGSLLGLTLETMSPPHLARAAIEGLLCGLADGVDALAGQGCRVDRVLLVGGGAASEAVRRLAPAVLGVPVHIPPPAEYVARGAARQAAWCLAGGGEPPAWSVPDTVVSEGGPDPRVRRRYDEARGHWLSRQRA